MLHLLKTSMTAEGRTKPNANKFMTKPKDWKVLLKDKTYCINKTYILTSNIYSVPRLNLVNKIIVSKKDDSVRCLTCRHIFRRFLKFDLKEQWKTENSRNEESIMGKNCKSLYHLEIFLMPSIFFKTFFLSPINTFKKIWHEHAFCEVIYLNIPLRETGGDLGHYFFSLPF